METPELLTYLDTKFTNLKNELSGDIGDKIDGHYLRCTNARLNAEKDQKSVEVKQPLWYSALNNAIIRFAVIIIVTIISFLGSVLIGKLSPEEKKAIDAIVTKTAQVNNDYN
jgi:hypothetical protein